MSTSLLLNVHESADISNFYEKSSEKAQYIRGYYEYYHYFCDGFDDRGWGCGYRTLQTICSWMIHNDLKGQVPSVPQIQEILVELEDKPKSFSGSRQWIGSFEVCLVIDKLFDIPCKIVHANKGTLHTTVDTLKSHFNNFGSPIMMGGDIDCSSKAVMGIHGSADSASLLVVDPHYVGKEESKEFLFRKGWVKWVPLNEFLTSSFYNLCLPQVKAKGKS